MMAVMLAVKTIMLMATDSRYTALTERAAGLECRWLLYSWRVGEIK